MQKELLAAAAAAKEGEKRGSQSLSASPGLTLPHPIFTSTKTDYALAKLFPDRDKSDKPCGEGGKQRAKQPLQLRILSAKSIEGESWLAGWLSVAA